MLLFYEYIIVFDFLKLLGRLVNAKQRAHNHVYKNVHLDPYLLHFIVRKTSRLSLNKRIYILCESGFCISVKM